MVLVSDIARRAQVEHLPVTNLPQKGFVVEAGLQSELRIGGHHLRVVAKDRVGVYLPLRHILQRGGVSEQGLGR